MDAVTALVCTASLFCFAESVAARFTDVPENEWFAESVTYVRNKGWMNGMTETTFEPQRSITRGMIVTILYRSEGAPDVKNENLFSDVDEASYYSDPIKWACENGIVNGYDKNTFAPNDEITREQFATILYRYAKTKGMDVSVDAENSELSFLEDVEKIRPYAMEAMFWAYEKGLIRGVTSVTLEPQGQATRAQAATIFMRFDKLFDSFEAEKKNGLEKDENRDVTDSFTKSEGTASGSNSIVKDTAKDTDDKSAVDENAGEWDKVTDGEKTTDETKSEASKENTGHINPMIVVDSASAQAGESVEIAIRIRNSPKILGAVLNFQFDEALTLTDAQKGDAFSKLEMTKPGKFVTNCNFVWDGLDEPAEDDGVILILTFSVSDKADKGDKYEIECSYLPGDLVDENFEELDVTLVGGVITVE